MQPITTAITYLLAHLRSERGQDLLEYALLGGLIAAAILAVGITGIMTGAIDAMVDAIGNCIDFDSGTPCDIFIN